MVNRSEGISRGRCHDDDTLRVVEEIRQHHAAGNVLVISHKATIRIILCGLLGIDVGRYRYRLGCPVGSVSVVEATNFWTLLSASVNGLGGRLGQTSAKFS